MSSRPPKLPPGFDPLTLPVAGISADPPIAPRYLTPHGMRSSFKVESDWQPEVTDEQRFRLDEGGAFTPASVLIPVVMREPGMTLLLTRRTAHLNEHAGQISFPGGRAEAHDATPTETALRETEEEIGLARRHIEPLGHLPEYLTNSGFRVTPVVSLVTPPFDLAADNFEVAEIFEVPLAFLMDPRNHQTRSAVLQDGVRTFYTMPYGRHCIWGATAGMLRNFYGFLSAHLPR